MIRTIIQSAVEGVIKRFTASGRQNETIEDREMFQQYGFTSMPQPGAEGIVIHEGNHYIMIATEDRRYRIPIEAGEVCLYTDEGDFIRLERGKQISITSGNKIVATSTNEVDAFAPVVMLGDANALQLLTEAFLTLYNGHTHDPNTGVPVQQAGAAQMTTKVKAT